MTIDELERLAKFCTIAWLDAPPTLVTIPAPTVLALVAVARAAMAVRVLRASDSDAAFAKALDAALAALEALP